MSILSDEAARKVFLGNLEILRKHHGLKKGEFFKKAGISNLRRKNAGMPRNSTIKAICLTYGVTKEWLLTQHSVDVPIPKPKTNVIKMTGGRISAEDVERINFARNVVVLTLDELSIEADQNIINDLAAEYINLWDSKDDEPGEKELLKMIIKKRIGQK